MAQATGKPRGLRWKDCQFEVTRGVCPRQADRRSRRLVAVTIAFEALPGSDMEDNPNVGNLRNASAVFFYHKGHWSTVGKAVFNMNPNEAIEHFKNQYERVGP